MSWLQTLGKTEVSFILNLFKLEIEIYDDYITSFEY